MAGLSLPGHVRKAYSNPVSGKVVQIPFFLGLLACLESLGVVLAGNRAVMIAMRFRWSFRSSLSSDGQEKVRRCEDYRRSHRSATVRAFERHAFHVYVEMALWLAVAGVKCSTFGRDFEGASGRWTHQARVFDSILTALPTPSLISFISQMILVLWPQTVTAARRFQYSAGVCRFWEFS